MRKICLDLDSLVVESFRVETAEPAVRGTVHGRDGAVTEVRHCNSENVPTCAFTCAC